MAKHLIGETFWQILRCQKRVSGPTLGRIDIHLEIPAVKVEKLTAGDNIEREASAQIRKKVQKARDIQLKRFKNTKISSNAEMINRDIKKFCELSNECLSFLRMAVTPMNLSARSYHRIIKPTRVSQI